MESKEPENFKPEKSRTKESIKRGPFESFFLKKGLERDKDMSEIISEQETERKEKVLKELKLERKSAKSKKKKI